MKNNFFFLLFLISHFVTSQTKKDTLEPVTDDLRASTKSFSEKEFYASQEDELSEKGTFFQFDFSVPLRGNDTYGEIDENGNRSDYWFLPDGLATKFGYGGYLKNWICISANTGIDWVGSHKLVSVPVYGAISLQPGIANETRLIFQFGYGKSFALGRGNLMGTYKKFRIGIIGVDSFSLFADVSLNGFALYDISETGSFSLGLSFFTF
jgi:hypothetical protein